MNRWTQFFHGTACHILPSTKLSVVMLPCRSLLFVEPVELCFSRVEVGEGEHVMVGVAVGAPTILISGQLQ